MVELQSNIGQAVFVALALCRSYLEILAIAMQEAELACDGGTGPSQSLLTLVRGPAAESSRNPPNVLACRDW